MVNYSQSVQVVVEGVTYQNRIPVDKGVQGFPNRLEGQNCFGIIVCLCNAGEAGVEVSGMYSDTRI
jgi:hypothetical protein